ncbi:nuclear transport factor 2 family protein [Leifsonia poae]|uniref:nuclear transport factor 2 family protein n=1 Tax=Leifsonia poae TaxID=110933 RepID=UPI001CBCBA7E|nr:nuclear transport factor 2 family protein [Leifsonia poae]
MTVTDPHAFARSWVDAWNSHDLDAVLAHFADEATFSSPAARQLLDGSDGVLRGKTEIRAYWSEGLRRIPDLRFEVVDVYAGLDALVINYRNQRGGLVCEVLIFDGDLVISGHGTYQESGDDLAGATRS